MEHHVNIEERESTVLSMDKDVLRLSLSLPESECCIYRVHKEIRKVKPEAYEPTLVSIGPYHLQNDKLQAMKKHKQRYLHLLLKRRGEESVKKYILKLKEIEGRARECYADPIDLSSDKFLEMMLLDGCFIIELIRKIIDEKSFDAEDPILNVDWMLSKILRDIMLLENQLPFFILSQLYDMTKDPVEGLPFINAMLVFSDRVPKPRLRSIQEEGTYDSQKIKHLLHLVHILCCPSPKETSPKKRERGKQNVVSRIRGVEELSREAGFKFKKKDVYIDTDTPKLFDIKFHKGSMEIPCFTVDDSTDAFFRNLIAYEQHSLDVYTKYFTDFASLMNQLIDSEKDVKLLCDKGIIMNCLGDDKKVSDLFNKLGDGLMVSSENFYYAEERRKVNEHRKKLRYRLMAKLRHDFIHKPWAGVSTIAAAVLLLLTLLQTIATLKAM